MYLSCDHIFDVFFYFNLFLTFLPSKQARDLIVGYLESPNNDPQMPLLEIFPHSHTLHTIPHHCSVKY
jgi:hypothetical protein